MNEAYVVTDRPGEIRPGVTKRVADNDAPEPLARAGGVPGRMNDR